MTGLVDVGVLVFVRRGLVDLRFVSIGGGGPGGGGGGGITSGGGESGGGGGGGGIALGRLRLRLSGSSSLELNELELSLLELSMVVSC